MFERDSLKVLQERARANYTGLFKPLDKTARYNLVGVLADVDAGMHHMMRGDLDFLSKQIFPDTAEGEYLRAHWSGRVAPLYAVAAAGTVTVSGAPGASVPAGVVFSSDAGKRYFTGDSCRVCEGGSVTVRVKAEEPGTDSNIEAGKNLSIVSSIPSGIDSKAVTGADGIAGGGDSESDEAYLARVLRYLQNPARYGKGGDYAAWASDSSPEVSAAWEYKKFGVFGAVLVQVINGSQKNGVHQVGNLQAVRDYISAVSPPALFTVRTPELLPLDPALSLPPAEDTLYNRDLAAQRMKAYLQLMAAPGVTVTSGALRAAFIDGVDITGATVKLGGDAAGSIGTTILQYPVLGELSWE